MFFNSLKEIHRLRKEMKRLLSKGMSNIHLEGTVEKKWRAPDFGFLSLESSSPGMVLGSSNSCGYHWISKLKNQRSGNKTLCSFSIIFILKRIMTF